MNQATAAMQTHTGQLQRASQLTRETLREDLQGFYTKLNTLGVFRWSVFRTIVGGFARD